MNVISKCFTGAAGEPARSMDPYSDSNAVKTSLNTRGDSVACGRFVWQDLKRLGRLAL
jgi:hypothetical protein